METILVTATLLWSFKAGAPADAAAVVAGDRVYFACADKKLYALRLADGEKVWARRFKAPLAASPAAAAGAVFHYVPYPEGKIYAFREASGKRAWRAAAGKGLVNVAATAAFVAAPLGDAVVFYDAGSGEQVGKCNLGGRVAGVVAAPGELFVAWTAGGDVAAIRAGAPSPRWKKNAAPTGLFVTVGDDRVFAVGAPGVVVALSLEDGDEIWRREFPGPAAGPPSPAGPIVIVPFRRTVVALDAADGVTSWEQPAAANAVGAAPYRDGAVIVYEDGRWAWASAAAAADLGALAGRVTAAPTVAGDLVLVSDGVNRLNCYRLR